MDFEAAILWQQTLMAVEHLHRPEKISIGGQKNATLKVCADLLPKDGFELLTKTSVGMVIFSAPFLRVFVNGCQMTEDRRLISPTDQLRVELGSIVVLIRPIQTMSVLPSSWWRQIDPIFTGILSVLLVAQASVLTNFALAPGGSISAPEDLLKNPEPFREILIKKVEKRRQVQLALSGTKGAQAKEDEGKMGKVELPKEDKAASKKGAPVVIKDRSEQNRQLAYKMLTDLGLTKDKAAAASVFGPGGTGAGLNESLGGLKGEASGDAGGNRGLGTRGGGSGGGGKAEGLGGVGSGTGRGTGGIGDLALGGQGRSRVRVEPGNILYEGSLTKDEIQRVIDRFITQIKYCYDREFQKSPDLQGKLVANWVIGSEGLIANSKIVENTMNNSDVEKCVLRVVNRMQFPKPRGGGVVTVTYPFVFSAAGV